MTKGDFLELRAGEQRWILLRCLRFVLGMLVNEKPPLTRAILAQFDDMADRAAQEETEDES